MKRSRPRRSHVVRRRQYDGRLKRFGTEELPAYERALREACNGTPPPFGQAWYGEKYRLLASDPAWLATSLIANAEKEGDGARKLWQLAAGSQDPEITLNEVGEARFVGE